MVKKVYEIAIMGRATWNLHSLSNEGTVGNVTEPRTIILADGTKTDGISGEMLKHIHAENMWALERDKTKFCQVCEKFRPERADGNPEVRKTKEVEDAVEKAIKCVLCDTHGFLVQVPTVSRQSTIEFGWAVGIPEVQRSTHVHARQAVHTAYIPIDEEREKGKWGREKCSEGDCETKEEDSSLFRIKGKWYCEAHRPTATPQMLYYRPTRSGTYAIISVFQPWRIGLNNVTRKYVEGINRSERYKLALKAYQAMFLKPEGAMTTTRLPHTENFEGTIIVCRASFPAPVISPIKIDYKEEIKSIIKNLEDIEMIEFKSLSEFVEKIRELLEDIPYSIA
jgi:CRISPR-associated protein Cst2